jgi:hypothetical protein
VIKQATILGLCSVVLFGCVAGDPVDDSSEAQVYTETVVVFDENGEETVTVRELTEEEALRPAVSDRASGDPESEENVGEAAQELSKGSCTVDTLSLRDGQYQTGNRICFYHYGLAQTIDLANYCRSIRVCYPGGGCSTACIGSWAGWVASYSAGSFVGSFIAEDGAEAYYSFYERQDTPSSPAVTGARYISALKNTPN